MIREASCADHNNLSALSIQVWLETYARDGIRSEYSEFVLSKFTAEYFTNLIEGSRHKVIVFEDGNFIRGFASINFDSHYENESNGFEIEHLYVHGPFKNAGVGRQLLDYIKVHYGKRFWLYTWVENDSNGFYDHLGLKNIGKYHFNFHDWVIKNSVYAYLGA